jgi:hypothetical protein
MNLNIYNINLNVNINVSGRDGRDRADSPTDLVHGGGDVIKRAQANSPKKPTDDVGLDPFDMINQSDEERVHNDGK